MLVWDEDIGYMDHPCMQGHLEEGKGEEVQPIDM